MTRKPIKATTETPETKVAVVGTDGPELPQEWVPGQGDYSIEPLYWPC